jgi:hypothetical protein
MAAHLLHEYAGICVTAPRQFSSELWKSWWKTPADWLQVPCCNEPVTYCTQIKQIPDYADKLFYFNRLRSLLPAKYHW